MWSPGGRLSVPCFLWTGLQPPWPSLRSTVTNQGRSSRETTWGKIKGAREAHKDLETYHRRGMQTSYQRPHLWITVVKCHQILPRETHSFQGRSPLCLPLPGKTIKLSFLFDLKLWDLIWHQRQRGQAFGNKSIREDLLWGEMIKGRAKFSDHMLRPGVLRFGKPVAGAGAWNVTDRAKCWQTASITFPRVSVCPGENCNKDSLSQPVPWDGRKRAHGTGLWENRNRLHHFLHPWN